MVMCTPYTYMRISMSNFMANDLTWEQWETKYQHELNEHPANYELQFVRQCIKPTGIQPKHVIPQYHFKDSNGKNRYIDFVIIIREGVYLPIEIDGLSKMIDYDNTHEQRYERFNDFLFRQNEIINRFGTILRYSNKYWLSNPNKVADEIKQNIKRIHYLHKPKIIKKKTLASKNYSLVEWFKIFYIYVKFWFKEFLKELFLHDAQRKYFS